MNALEGLIVQHVLPEFQNPTYPFMRERACWIVMRYCDLDFDNEHNLQCCVQKVLKALRDPELPVQMMAATSLRFLLDSDTAQIVISPVLPQVLDEFFRLMNEIGLDDLVCSLEKIIQRFGDQIAQIAPQLVIKLASMFQRLFKKDDNEEDDEAQMAALTTLECINTILEQTWEMPDVYVTALSFYSLTYLPPILTHTHTHTDTENSNPQLCRFFNSSFIQTVKLWSI